MERKLETKKVVYIAKLDIVIQLKVKLMEPSPLQIHTHTHTHIVVVREGRSQEEVNMKKIIIM